MSKLINYLINLLSVFSIIVKRLRNYWGLSISAEIGIISVMSLVICVPVFTNAVLSEVLRQELSEKAIKNHRSLFSIHAYYLDDTLFTPLAFNDTRYVSQWLTDQLTKLIGLKTTGVYLDVATKPYVWKPIKFKSTKAPFPDIHLSLSANDIVTRKTRLVEGVWPVYDPAINTIPDPLPVAVYEGFADEKFVNVGDILQIENPTLRIEIVGIFRAIDPNDMDWFYSPETTFNKEAWVPMEFFGNYLTTIFERPINYSSWYAIVDEQSLRYDNSLFYSRSMMRLENTFKAILPKIKIDYSPLEQLKAYESRMQSLIIFFYVVGAPMVLISLIFISLTASIVVQQLEQEIVTMRGRGISLGVMLFQNIVESIVLILIALPFSISLGWFSAHIMGQTRSFLQFTPRSDFFYSLRDINPIWFIIVSIFIVTTRLLPLLALKHTTVVKVKQERSRSIGKPFWQRLFIDFLILIPAAYSYWILRHQMDNLILINDQRTNSNLGQYDPLQFLASTLFVIAVCMIALRVFPFLLRLLRTIVNRRFPVGSYLAIQEIARRPQERYNVMILIMISLSLAIFSASMAKTLDQWMHDTQYYQTGADLVVKEYEIPLANSPSLGSAAPPTQKTPNTINAVESLIDLEKHLQIPDIRSATFVGKYNGSFYSGAGWKDCMLMGIDRLSFPTTGYYRDDFAGKPLGELMNNLAVMPNGIIFPQDLLESFGLQIGDHLRVTAPLGLLDQGFDEDMIIMDTYQYFPTVYPADLPTLIINSGTLFGSPEAATGYEVWLNIQGNSNVQSVVDKLKTLALKDQLLIDVRGNSIKQIQKLTDQPEWVGLFGILSVGFMLTGLLPCIGFILDSFASLRKNFIQLGILQAIGLSIPQLISYLVLERLLLMVTALACGAGVGYLTSILFLPLLQITISPGAPVPPFQVLIGWRESTWLILAFSLVLLIAIVGTIGYLVRIKIFQAVKMGESI